MYSVVLMMAMTGGADVPAGHHGRGGCYGGCYGDCNGGCYGGWSCNGGCWGSCNGGCYGSSCYGGCHGHKRRHHGCHGCYGGCYGSCYGCNGCWGGCTGYYNCCGCNGTVVTGTCTGGEGGGANPDMNGGGDEKTYPVSAEEQKQLDEMVKAFKDQGDEQGAKDLQADWPKTSPADRKKAYDEYKAGKKEGEVRLPTFPAKIVVNLPADAKLTIDDAATVSTSDVRVFVSPKLPRGQEFNYTLTAEVVRDNQKVTASKVVTVRAGRETRVSLNPVATTGVASR